MPRILIIKTSSLGDVIHNLPIVDDILAQKRETHIDWAVEEAFADIPALHPGVERVIPVALRRWRKHLLDRATWREIKALRAQLHSYRYDLVLDTQGLLKSALLARLADAPIYGQDKSTVRERLAACFYQRHFPVARGRHAVIRNRDLAAQALGYVLPSGAPSYGLRVPSERGVLDSLPSRYTVCLHATSRDSKRWPDAHWIALGRELSSRGMPPLLPWGSAEEQTRSNVLAGQIPGAVVPPRLSLRQLAGVINNAAAVVGVDTGLVHLAAALNRPTVAIYIDSSPVLTGLLPGGDAQTASLGGRGETPSIQQVLQALDSVGVQPQIRVMH